MPRTTVSNEDAKAYVAMCQQLLDKQGATGAYRYRGGIGFLTAHGRSYGVAKARLGLRRGVPKQCFWNCFHVAQRNPRFLYAEGIAVPYIRPGGEWKPGIAVEHAWLVEKASGLAVEITFERPGLSYFGCTFKTEALAASLDGNDGMYSMLFAWMGQYWRKIMMGRVSAKRLLYQEAYEPK